MSKQGYYWQPHHDEVRGRILEHIRIAQPAFGVVQTEDYAPIAEAWAAHQHRICARVWAIDDHNGDAGWWLDVDPEQAAITLLDRYLRKRDEWYKAAGATPMPQPEYLFGSAWNEPNQQTTYAKIVEGTKHLLRRAIPEGMPFVVLKLGVGHPSGLVPTGAVDWSDFDDPELADLINASGSVVGLHAYFQPEGPMHSWTDEEGRLREDYPYLAGRHHSCPLDVEIVLDETGVDGGIFERAPGKGWQAFDIAPEGYAEMLRQTYKALDRRVIAQCPYLLDYNDKQWQTFDAVPALPAIAAWLKDVDDTTPPDDIEIDIPVVIAPKNKHIHTLKPTGPSGGTINDSVGIVDPQMALAIMNVEAGDEGFVDGQLKIRFEAHIFQQQLGNDEWFNRWFKIAKENPSQAQQWMRDERGTLTPIHTGSQATEYKAFELARQMDREAAYNSIGMGIAQIMGFNHQRVGWPSAEAMYKDFAASETAQIVAFFNYVLSRPDLMVAIRNKDWRRIAWLYNGNAVDVYAPRLEAAYLKRIANG